jgi:hypothetical protein
VIETTPVELLRSHRKRCPELKPCRRGKQKIKTRIAKIDEQLGQRAFSRSGLDLRGISEVALQRGNSKLLHQRKQLAAELEHVIERPKELAAKVNKLELLKERDIRRLDFRKEIVMGLLRVTAHNARQMALGVLD